MPAVAVRNLAKSYGDKQAVRDVSFEVEKGEVFALLGPNGAGKTTTIEILEGFRERSGGEVETLGVDPANRASQRWLRCHIGVVLQELAVEPYYTVRQVLSRNAGYYPAPRPIDEVIALVGLTEKADKRIKTLSGGQQRRLDVGLGVIGNPELLFLDEPTTGLDPSGRRDTWNLIRQLAADGTTVMLTTHYMDEVEALADRVAVLSRAQIVAAGTPVSIGGRDSGAVTIRFALPDGVSVTDLPVSGCTLDEGQIEIHTEDELRVLHDLTGWAIERDLTLPGLAVVRVTLEDVYLQLTRGRPRHGGHPLMSTLTPAAQPTTGSFRGIGDVKLVGRQVWYEQLSFWLNPIGAVFTVGFSLVFLLLLGATAGNSRSAIYGNIKLTQYYVPGFVAYGIMAACFNILAIQTVNRREVGLLKRIRLSPLPTWVLLTAIIVSSMIISAVEVVVLLAVGRVGFGVHGPASMGAFVLAVVVGMISFSAMGLGMSTLVPNQDAAGPIISIVFFVLLFLSGLWYPINPGSGLAKISSYTPVRHMITAVIHTFQPAEGRVAMGMA